ncbi:PhoU-like phosphate uptake regulator [Rhodothalassium salexigens DSM 2132]|uniref:Phosphate-specific transport system accessory protein PhoU n=1 Tax=Rhodothalassium salexigens DSM 2132 TaxID=1188247 RepID=A0A4R2PQ32_RHOSA|nr:phosphate signaling complex protein PhoU [Rhodothalassium salexigens]MBB4210551.1 phosphate transport system protein [Rhodothalassium salexigens DSM 2132]MBK1638040.1 phosphate transport system regulatory protein PhoU [Rhodothalassium salexigens DSM 2132]TCP37892.1 PhoU-like phosphate uptake regulator [Rhodothalassium salexigens DSM 2132]
MTQAHTHTLKSYDKELDDLRTLVSQMGGFAEAQVRSAVDCLTTRDTAMAERVVAADRKLDAMELELERQVHGIIARRSPVADDLRGVIAALKISGALERVGDYAKNIAKRATVLNQSSPIRAVGILPQMAAETQRMIADVIDAYVEADSGRAIDVWQRDERVDALYNSLFRELLTYMMENTRLITPCTHLLFCAKNLERVGDHATNIAEMVYFSITGVVMEDVRPKGDDTSYTTLDPNDPERYGA